MVGASADLSDVVLESEDHELALGDEKQGSPSRTRGVRLLYEWTLAEGLQLVNFNPEGKLLKCGAVLGQSGGTSESARRAAPTARCRPMGRRGLLHRARPRRRSGVRPEGPGCWNGGKDEPAASCMCVRTGKRRSRCPRPKEALRLGSRAKPGRTRDLRRRLKGRLEGVLHDQDRADRGSREAGAARRGAVRVQHRCRAKAKRRSCVSRAGRRSGEAATTPAACEDVPAVAGDGSAVYFNASGELTATHLAEVVACTVTTRAPARRRMSRRTPAIPSHGGARPGDGSCVVRTALAERWREHLPVST